MGDQFGTYLITKLITHFIYKVCRAKTLNKTLKKKPTKVGSHN